MTKSRRGMTLIEVLVALLLGLALLHMAMSGLATAKRTESDLRARSERLATIRAARVALRRSVTASVEGRDWIAHVPDSVVVRAFQGVALPCPTELPEDGVLVAFSGRRLPDPSEDSVSALDDHGGWTASRLAAVRSAEEPCATDPGFETQRWVLDPPPAAEAVLYRLFESASFHVADGALRYRIGGGGRQPLSPEVLGRPDGGGFALDRALEVRLRGAAGSWSWRAYLAEHR